MWLAECRSFYQVQSSTRVMCRAEPKLHAAKTCQVLLWGKSAASVAVCNLCGENTHWKCVITGFGVYLEEGKGFHQGIILCTAKQGWFFFFFFLREPFVKILASLLCREDRTALCWSWGWHILFPACRVCKGSGEGCHLMANLVRLQHAELIYLATSFQARLLLSRCFLKSYVQLQNKVKFYSELCAVSFTPGLPEPGVFWCPSCQCFMSEQTGSYEKPWGQGHHLSEKRPIVTDGFRV